MLVEVAFHACIFGIDLLYLLQAIVISKCKINIHDNYEKSRRFKMFKITQNTVIFWWHLEPGQKHRGPLVDRVWEEKSSSSLQSTRSLFSHLNHILTARVTLFKGYFVLIALEWVANEFNDETLV